MNLVDDVLTLGVTRAARTSARLVMAEDERRDDRRH